MVKGDLVRDLESADSRLIERELHEWKDAEATSLKVIAGGKTRALVRGGAEGKNSGRTAGPPTRTTRPWATG